MPTDRYGKVKHLLRQGKAVVVKRCPFTIRLLYDTTAYTQKLTLGVDTGSGTLGTAVSDEKGNIVYMSEVTVRNDITDKMKQRLRYRRNRRNRKNRYRKARYLNRRNSIKSDRFSPTMTSKFHSHIKEIDYIKSILSVKTLVLETGQFDTHLLKKPCLANPKVRHCTVAELILIFQAETKPVFLITDILYLKNPYLTGIFNRQRVSVRNRSLIQVKFTVSENLIRWDIWVTSISSREEWVQVMQCLWTLTERKQISVKCLKVLKPQNLASAGVYQQENHNWYRQWQYNARKPTV